MTLHDSLEITNQLVLFYITKQNKNSIKNIATYTTDLYNIHIPHYDELIKQRTGRGSLHLGNCETSKYPQPKHGFSRLLSINTNTERRQRLHQQQQSSAIEKNKIKTTCQRNQFAGVLELQT